MLAQAGQPAYPTMDAAAVAAVNTCFAISQRTELAGVLYQWHGEWHYTAPVGNGYASEVGGTEVIRLPAGSVIAGDYHTHPASLSGEDLSQFFSSADVAAYRATHWTGYVGVWKTGEVLRWRGSTHLESFGGSITSVGDGQVVGRIDHAGN